MPRQRLLDAMDAIEAGTVGDLHAFAATFHNIDQAYARDEWAWVKNNYRDVLGLDLDNAEQTDLIGIADAYLKARGKFLRMVVADAEKEFDELSHSGFGQDGAAEDIGADFREVRGCYEDNKFVKKMRSEIDALESRVTEFKNKLANMQ